MFTKKQRTPDRTVWKPTTKKQDFSVALVLFDEAWPWPSALSTWSLGNQDPAGQKEWLEISETMRIGANLRKMRTYSEQDLAEERKLGVSTQLTLYHDISTTVKIVDQNPEFHNPEEVDRQSVEKRQVHINSSMPSWNGKRSRTSPPTAFKPAPNKKEVSVALVLFDESWSWRCMANTCSPRNQEPAGSTESLAENKRIAANLRKMRTYSDRDLIEESIHGVSTQPTLYLDPWKIKKKLTRSEWSNVDPLSRILVGKGKSQETRSIVVERG